MPTLPKNLERQTPDPRLRAALVAVLRKLGLVGATPPSDADLLRIAKSFTEKSDLFGRAVGRTVAADDQGRAFEFGRCLSPPNPVIDKEIPF